MSQAVGSPPSKPGAEPLHALLTRPVGERVRVDAAALLLLDPVVPDRRGRRQPFFDVAGLDEVVLRVGGVGPDAGKAVRLELEPHRELVGVVGVLLPLEVDVLHHAEEVLDVVAELVRDHVGPREVAGGAELLLQLVEEGEVEIDLAVAGTVERADRRRRRPAGGLRAIVEEDDHRRLVRRAALGEDLRPGRVDLARDDVDELSGVVLGNVIDSCAAGGRLRQLARARVDPEAAASTWEAADQQVDDEQEDQTDPAAARLAEREREGHAAADAACAAAVLDPARSRTSAPLHDKPDSRSTRF